MLVELLRDMFSSTTQGYFGVTGIYVYFVAIVAAAIYRIKEGMKEGHH
ncbi:hypothetical protein [Desulfonatronovibrio hydrogenovorans]|nr:hypothetical protein [Desulfonatronovibrio hydrogenovorans]